MGFANSSNCIDWPADVLVVDYWQTNISYMSWLLEA